LRCSALLLLLCAAPAHAFDDASQFFVQSMAHAATLGASAEGVYFTGAPRFSTLDCASCHTGSPGLVTLQLGADPADLFSDGYVPGATYQIEVALGNEVEGLEYGGATCTEPPLATDHFAYVQCNNNNFALEIDAGATPLVSFCAAPPVAGTCPAPDAQNDEVLVAPGGDAVFANRAHDTQTPYVVLRNGATRWHLWWTAPPAGSGPVTLYAAVVDGNGGQGVGAVDQDPFGDDTVRAVVAVQERGAAVPNGVVAGCALGRAGGVGPLVLLVLATARRRRRRARR
jgi:hypothetical protein